VALTGILPYLFWKEKLRTHDLLCESYGPVDPSWCYTSPEDFFFALVILSAAFCLCLIVSLSRNRQKIKMAAGILRITSKPLRVMHRLFWFPLIQVVVGSVLVVFLGIVVIWTMGTGTISTVDNNNTPDGESKVIEFTVAEKFMLMCNVFMTFWWLSVLVEMGRFVVSCAVSVWYFSRERSVLYVRAK
jgi:hypothetical protein